MFFQRGPQRAGPREREGLAHNAAGNRDFPPAICALFPKCNERAGADACLSQRVIRTSRRLTGDGFDASQRRPDSRQT